MEKKKQQRKAISLGMKIEILDRLAKGEGSTAIGNHFGLGESTIRAIKKNEAAIRKSVISGTKLSAKLSSYSRSVLIEKTEQALKIWIENLTKNRTPIGSNLIKQKALQFYRQIKQLEPSTSRTEKDFSASTGWLTGFLKRNAFHIVKLSGEDPSGDEEAAKFFSEKLVKIIEDGGYCPDQVFNAGETGLFWKKMPSRTFIAKSEEIASGFKAAKDRVTFLLCSNASGDRMLKPLLVNRSFRPCTLKDKDLKELPVHWMSNKNAWVTTTVFAEWFNNCFLPEVEEYMKQKALDFKILLIVDNAPGHPHLEHPNVQLVFFPPSNVTSVIQPLDQGIITTFKNYYIRHTFQFILDKLQNESMTVTDIWKEFSILDCLNHAVSAIAEIRPQTLNACWKTAWPGCVANGNATNQSSTVSTEVIALAHKIGGEGFDTFSENDVNELLVDNVLSDDDIIGITLDPVEDSEDYSEAEEEPVLLTANIIREGLQLCTKLENHFLVNDTNFERAFKFQCDLKNCISEYRELYKKLGKSPLRSAITECAAMEKKSMQDEREIYANSIREEVIRLSLLCRSDMLTLSSNEESSFAPVHKRLRIKLENDKNSDDQV